MTPASRDCPVCGGKSERAAIFLEGNIDTKELTGFSFASRKEPEYMCHRLVQCPTCDLVYVDEPPGQDALAEAYHLADYDSSEEADDAAAAYILAIAPTLRALTRRVSALEIGTGTGVFLERLARAGFTDLVGVEPSPAAIAAAPASRRGWIREAIFDEHDFAPASFDLICCFMTMEHVRDPGSVARAAMRLLRPGGAFVTVTHDYRSVINRILGKRSPIIDIEHMQLFSPRSVRTLFENCGYQSVTVKAFVNTYALRYWVRLAPFPAGAKRQLSSLLSKIGLGGVKMGFNVGNIATAGFKGD